MEKNDLLIVSIDDYSLDVLLKESFYATKRKLDPQFKFIAFYQKGVIGAITYYGIIDKVLEGDKNDVGMVYWLRNFPEKDPPYIIVRFKKIVRLKKPLKRDIKRGVQGPIKSNFKKLEEASKLSDLINVAVKKPTNS